MLAINGSLQHSGTYIKGKDIDKRKEEFRASLRKQLRSKSKEYEEGQVREEDHIANIQNLSLDLSKNYSEILVGDEFRIGIAQKALNLYLKYCWARGIIEEPPHCPIDRIVLEKVRCSHVNWTQICKIEEYKTLIDKVRKEAEAQGQTLARWELGIWQTAMSPGVR